MKNLSEKRLNFLMDKETYARLVDLAKESDKTISSYIRMIINQKYDFVLGRKFETFYATVFRICDNARDDNSAIIILDSLWDKNEFKDNIVEGGEDSMFYDLPEKAKSVITNIVMDDRSLENWLYVDTLEVIRQQVPRDSSMEQRIQLMEQLGKYVNEKWNKQE